MRNTSFGVGAVLAIATTVAGIAWHQATPIAQEARFAGPTSSQPLALSADGALLAVVNPDNDSVTFFNTGGGTATKLGADPTKSTRYFVDEIISSDAFDVAVKATLDADALMLFGINVANFGANTLSVALSLGLGVLPFVDPTVAFSSISGTLNAGPQAPNGVTLGVGQLSDPDGDGLSEMLVSGFDGGSLGIDVGVSSSVPGLYGAFGSGPVVGPTGPLFTFLESTVAFSVTGGGDVADLEGITSVQAVPEPGSLGLLGLGLVALGRRLRDRRRGA